MNVGIFVEVIGGMWYYKKNIVICEGELFVEIEGGNSFFLFNYIVDFYM